MNRKIRIVPNLSFAVTAVALVVLATAICVRWGFGLAHVPWNYGRLAPSTWISAGALWLACLSLVAVLRVLANWLSVNHTVERVTLGVLSA